MNVDPEGAAYWASVEAAEEDGCGQTAPTINTLTGKPCNYCAGTGLDERAMADDRTVKGFITNLRLVDRLCPYCVPVVKEVA